MNLPGKFIVIEGLDGSGSTTQAAILASRLRQEGRKVSKVVQTREPSEGPGGLLIRLSLAKRLPLDDKTRALLFAADRVDHLFSRRGIAPFLRAQGSVVVCERYLLSFLAYQSFDAKVDLEWLRTVSQQVIPPTLTIWLDTPPEVCLRRIIAGRGFHQELYETNEQLTAIARQFEAAAKFLQSAGFVVARIDGQGTVRQVANRIRVLVDGLLLHGHAPRSEWENFFDQNLHLKELVLRLERTGFVVELRAIQAGLQIRVFDGFDVVHINVFHTGTVNVQGTASEARLRAEEVIKGLKQSFFWLMPSSTKVHQSELFPEGELEKVRQETLFPSGGPETS